MLLLDLSANKMMIGRVGLCIVSDKISDTNGSRQTWQVEITQRTCHMFDYLFFIYVNPFKHVGLLHTCLSIQRTSYVNVYRHL